MSESPGCEFDAETDTIGTVTCTFEANGDSNHTVESVLLEPDCSDDNTNGGLTQDADPIFTRNGDSSTYTVSVSIENSALQEGDASIDFCIEASVKAGGSDDVFAQLGQKVKLDLNTDGSFSFNTTSAVADTISAEADALDTTLRVSAYQCDDSGNSASSDLSLGETLYICIDGVQDTVIVDAINNMQATKSGVSDLDLSIIDGSNPTNNAITTINYTGTNKAIVTTILPITFFESSDAVTVSGNADIKAGGSRRQLSSMGKVVSRPVVVDQGADSAKFNLKVGVIPVSGPLEDEGAWEDVKLKTMPNSAARVQAFKISAAAALIIFWW